MRLRHWQPQQALSALPIRIDPAAQEAGLALGLVETMRKSVERQPGLRTHFDRMRGEVAIKAVDAEVAVTMEFLGGKLLVHDGIQKGADLVISGRKSALLESRAFLSRRIRIRGRALLFKPLLLPRFLQLISTVEQEGEEGYSEQPATLEGLSEQPITVREE